MTHHVEHVVPRQHGGTDEISNLALACHRCNLQNGLNLTGIDPVTGEVNRWESSPRPQDASGIGGFLPGFPGRPL
ncbi:MAG: HNH endonuclease [Bryobacterales bacterium]|nr:HNH endonuclease [Bryobacterales bacterium]